MSKPTIEVQADTFVWNEICYQGLEYLRGGNSYPLFVKCFLMGAKAQRELSDETPSGERMFHLEKQIKSLAEKLESITADRDALDNGNIKLNEQVNPLTEKLETAHEVMAKANIALANQGDWPTAFGHLNTYLCGLSEKESGE